MQKIYIQHEGLNEKFPIVIFGDDGFVKARFSNEVSAERWAGLNRYIVGILSVGRG